MVQVKRGRKSAASKAAATILRPGVVPRPDPPEGLSDEAANEWRAVVDRLPSDWFPRETHPLLIQYCRHVVSSRKVDQLLAKTLRAKKLDVGAYNQLLIMQEREGRAMSSLATRMRITQQAAYDKTKKRKLDNGRKPWES